MSSADKKTLLLNTPGLSPDAVERHFARMDSDYWNEFSAEAIAAHVAALESLDPRAPWHVRVDRIGEGLCGLTLIGGDFQGFFAAVSGFLASAGYDVRVGKAFTFRSALEGRPAALPRGGLIDYLVLRHDDPARDAGEERTRLRAEMEDLFRRFGAGGSAAIRVELYRRIGARLEARNGLAGAAPLEIGTHVVNNATRLTIRARDREGMLFCIAGALSLQGLSLISLITMAHEDGFFENSLTVTGPGGQPVREARELEKIRTGIALMERLLQSLPSAVNLQAAAEGLQALVDDWLEESGELGEAGNTRNLNVLPALSRVLTAGPYLWEAVDQRGPRAFRELLADLSREVLIPDRAAHEAALRLLPATPEALRAYRDREILKAELDLLLTPARDWNGFAERLTALAEATLLFAVNAVRAGLAARHGEPYAGSAGYALLALGKFGGEELGSGSDLEVVLVHAGEGESAGPEPLRTGEFFERLMRELVRFWAVPQGETFALDLRLRPHGESGPLASSRQAWEDYYRKDPEKPGAALDYERQALIRLRTVSPENGLSAGLLAARDAILYQGPPLPIGETLTLFGKQAAAKEKPGIWNAKYGRGGLGELEYGIQFLQLRHGAARPIVRQHQWTRALDALLEAGVLSLAEFEHLYGANLFLRRLINALRLVRGQARDLYCPAVASAEFSFLAKRMHYAAEARLERDLKRTQNVVAGFFRYRFLDGPRPEWLYDSLAETLMDPAATLEEAAPALERLGMTDLARARRLFAELFDLLLEKRLAAALLLTFEGHFRRSPDPEGVLRHLLRYLQALPHPDVFIRQALHHPPLLEMLLLVFANSDPLSDLTVREGDGFKNLIEPASLEKPRLPAEFLLRALAAQDDPDFGPDPDTRLVRFRNREYLRIALRDLHLNIPLREITYEISGLTDALIEAVFRRTLEEAGHPDLGGHFCVLALGKLGGLELNYSSDIDLVFVMSDEAAAHDGIRGGRRGDAEQAARAFIGLLTRDTPEGRLFRVDMNLRPWGGQGPLVGSVSQYLEYFGVGPTGESQADTHADGWELQAWIKARTIRGPAAVGDAVIAQAQRQACAPENAERVVASMRKVRLLGLDKLHKGDGRGDQLASEVKLGPGGIRTVEFFTQALQIRHAAATPALLTGNTLEALGRLNRYGLLPGGRYGLLSEAYVFLRRIEHRLQLQGLQQRHAMPAAPAELDRLARQMGFEDRVGQPARLQFLEQYRKHMLSLQPVSAELFDH